MVVSTAFELCFGVSGQISMPLWGLQISASAGGAYSQVPLILSPVFSPFSCHLFLQERVHELVGMSRERLRQADVSKDAFRKLGRELCRQPFPLSCPSPELDISASGAG